MGNSHAREIRIAAKNSNADFIEKIDQKTGSILYFFKQDYSALCSKFDWNSASFKWDSYVAKIKYAISHTQIIKYYHKCDRNHTLTIFVQSIKFNLTKFVTF